MPLPFRPPLSNEEQAIYVTLPRLNGAVISPDHYPTRQRAAGEAAFLVWCDKHERRDWPQWVNDWHVRHHLQIRVAERQAGPRMDDGGGAGIPGGTRVTAVPGVNHGR